MNNEMNKTIDEENQLLLNSQGLAWSKICFDVSVASLLSRFKGTDALTTTKTILYDVSGLVLPGEILFILGPSGSGKSSTLDSLAMRVKAQVGGRVGLHGTLRQDAVWRAKVKYVEQEDNLFEVLSAKETLMYAAEFHVEKKTERQQRVLETIMRLGLENASDTKVGGTFYRGLSGGQRRRVSIGSEMVAMPDVLMLDEPTSGLDSASALKVMQHLREIANSGVVVVATMHQPSRQIWELADKLLLLSGGKTMYCGKRENAMQYFTRHGSVLPPLTSEPDFLLEEINSDFHEDKAKDERLAVGWEQSEERKKLEADIDTWFSSSSAMEQDTNEKTNLKGWGRNGKESVEYKRTILEQISVLASRNLKDALRNPAVIYLRFAMYVALAILIGIAWLRVPAEANRIQDLLGALFFANAFFIFMSIAVLPVYLNERRIVTRERLNGSYSVAAYLAGHFIIEAIMLGILSLIVTAIIYTMVGLHPNVGRAFFWALTLWLSLMVAESIMILIASVVPLFIVGIAMGAFLFGAFMVLQGYFTHLEYIPWPLRWLSFFGLHSYSFAAMVINEFDGRTYGATPNSFPPFPEPVEGKLVIEGLDFISNNKWVNIGVMALMLIVYRTAAFLWISKFHHGKK